MPPKSDNQKRESNILDASLKLIIQYGYDKTSMNDIAQEAHISKGAIYLHFESKDALFERLLWREGLAYAELWLNRVDNDPNGVTFASMFKHLLYALANSPLMSALFKRDKRVLGAYLKREPNRIQNALIMRQQLIVELQEAGAIRRDVAPDVLSFIMGMISYGLISIDDIIPKESQPPLEATIEAYSLILDHALTPETITDPERAKQALRNLMATARTMLNQKQ